MELVCHSVSLSRDQAFKNAELLLEAFENAFDGLDSEFKILRSLCGIWESRLTNHFVVVCPEKVFNLLYPNGIKTDLSQHLG